MRDRWIDSISSYLDGELEPSERRDLEAHIAGCPTCAATLEDLRRLVERARALPSQEPDQDLWPGIEARLRFGALRNARDARRTSGPRGGWMARRFAFSLPELAAACLAVALLSGGVMWLATRSPSRDAGRLRLAGPTGAARNASEEATRDVENLRQVLAAGRQDLDPATVRSLEESLTVIDIAIRQAQRALEADPKNPYVRDHLEETMRRKVDLLRRATQLASASD